MVNEALKQGKILFVLVCSCVCAYKFPLATIFFNIDDLKVLASLDIGFYNFVFSMIYALILFIINKQVLHIDFNISYPKQESDKIIFSKEDLNQNKDIELKIIAAGKVRKTHKTITLVCPESYIIQLHENSNRNFVSLSENCSNYEININEMVSRYRKDVSIAKTVKFSLALEEYNKGDKDFLIIENSIFLGLVRIKKNKLELKQN